MFKSFIHSKINIDYVTNMILQVMKKLVLIFKDFYTPWRGDFDTSYVIENISNIHYAFLKIPMQEECRTYSGGGNERNLKSSI